MVLFFTLMFSVLPVMAEKPPSGDIAMVNGVAISRADFDRELDAVRQRFAMQGQPPDEAKLSEIKENILDSLISRELFYQESRKGGVKIEASEVHEKFATWKKRFPDDSQLQNLMQMMNLSEEIVKSQIKEQMAVGKFIDQKFSDKVSVTEKEIRTYYDDNPDTFKKPEQVRASHILIKTDPKADDAEKSKTRDKIKDIREKLKKGEDFAALAKEFSECPSKSKGGDLGYFGRKQMVKPFEDVAFSLNTGEMSDIVETRFGYHLIKSVDKKAATTIPYKEVEGKIGEYLKEEKKMKEVTSYGEKLKAEAEIKRFLK